jgi:hypothetical protein
MAIIQGGKVMEGTAMPTRTALTTVQQAQQGGFYSSPGLPAGGFLNGVVHPGGYVLRADNGAVYQNTGTLAATVWTLVSP